MTRHHELLICVIAFVWLTSYVSAGVDVSVSTRDGTGADVVLAPTTGVSLDRMTLVAFSATEATLRVKGDGGGRANLTIRILLMDGKLHIAVTPSADDPEEPPPVDPLPIPEGYLGFTQSVYKWVTEDVDASKDPEKVKHAHGQAGNFRAIAAELAATPSKWENTADAAIELRRLNHKVLPQESANYLAWATYIAKLEVALKPLWPFDRVEAIKIYGAIADGLGRVK